MKLVNLTPHPVTVIGDDGSVIAQIPSSGIARARQSDEQVGTVQVGDHAVPIVKSTYGEPEGLPDPVPGVLLIVSALTAAAAAAAGRTTDDLLLTSAPVRDEQGQIIGCRQFARP